MHDCASVSQVDLSYFVQILQFGLVSYFIKYGPNDVLLTTE